MAVTAQLKNDKLIITIDILNPPRPSRTGNTTVVATSGGNQATTAQWEGKPIVVGVNAYVK